MEFESSTLTFTISDAVLSDTPIENLTIAYYNEENNMLELFDNTVNTVTGSAITAGTVSGSAITANIVYGGVITANTVSGSAINAVIISGNTITMQVGSLQYLYGSLPGSNRPNLLGFKNNG